MLASQVEALTQNFYAWEMRGRGWQSYPYPVSLEPPFRPFPGHVLPPQVVRDDGRLEHPLGARIAAFFAKLGGAGDAPRAGELEEAPSEEPEPEFFAATDALTETEIVLPPGVRVTPGAAEAFLLSLSSARYPVAYEVVGKESGIVLRLAARETDERSVTHQLRAFFPEAVPASPARSLRNMWDSLRGSAAVLEFGLGREFMLPLRTFREFSLDPLVPVLGALSELHEGEIGVLQVLFTPAVEPWPESILRAVTDGRGEPFFLDAPELTALAREKVAHPLFTAVIRTGAKSTTPGRTWEVIRGLAGALVHLGRPEANDLVPLAAEDDADLEEDFLARTSHRTGMLLGSAELASLVHLPHETVRIPALRREVRKTKRPPPVTLADGVALGLNLHEGETRTVCLSRDLRMRHVHVVGASGSGKSTLLTRMILADLRSGEGLAVLDPHGDLVDEILSRFPKEREQDLILFDPGDEEVSLGWNMLEARSETEKTLLASDLVGVFRRLSTSWGDQMNSVLANAILAFLESERGGTLLELRRFLVDRDFRAEFLRSVSDSEVLYYWQREFPLLVGKPQGPILTRLDTFLRPKPVRRVVVEREHRLDFRGIVDGGKVFLAKLAQGAIGEENAALLGSLLVSAFHQAAMSRQDLAPGTRRHFFLYLDEFHEVATPSMAALLTGARKYRLGLTLAHQELRQLEAKNKDLASAVLANAATRIVFRVGDDDARSLERGFSAFNAADLMNLGVGEAFARVERADHDFNLETAPLPDLDPALAVARREELVALTRTRFPRKEEADARDAIPAPSTPAPERQAPRPEPAARSVAPPSPVPSRPAAESSPPPKKAPRPAEPAPLGRGGPEHQYLQDLVKRWAESHGYRAVVEEEIPEGKGKVDVALRTDDFSLACEISVTSTVAQEVQNALKCLEAGFHEVAILALKRPRLQKIEAALKATLPPSDLARVHLVSPEELFTMLSMRPVTTEKVVGGYKVRVRRTPVEPEEEAARYQALKDVIGRSLRRMGKKEKP